MNVKNEICYYEMSGTIGSSKDNTLCANSNANEQKFITELYDMTIYRNY